MAIMGNFGTPHTFLKIKLDNCSSEISKLNGMPILSGILRLPNITRSLKLPLYKTKL